MTRDPQPMLEIVARADFSDASFRLKIRRPMMARVPARANPSAGLKIEP